jgi:GLPGLI family protein
MKITFFLFLCTSICCSQIKSGVINYNVRLDTLEGIQKTKFLKNNLDKAIKGAKNLSFTLTFDKQNSFFRMDELMNTDNNEIGLAKIFSNYRGEIYQNKEHSFAKIENEFGRFMVKKEISKNWVITNETKYIDNYKCYKASTEYIVVNPKGTFKYPVYAWFCPEIPIPFGPNGYGNLPGLILELQERNVVFGVVKMQLNTKVTLSFDSNKNDKVLTEDEYNIVIEKMTKKYLDQD